MPDDVPDFIANPTDEDYAVAAEVALRENDVALALEQAAAALAVRPTHAPWLGLVDRVLDAARNPLDLTRLEGSTFFGTIAVRARALARTGDMDEAFALLFDVVAFRPALPYLAWTRAWTGDRSRLRAASAASLAAKASRFAQALDATNARAPGVTENADAAIDLLRSVHEATGRIDPSPIVVASSIARRIGRLDDALAWTERELARAPTWAVAVELAMVHGARGDTTARADALRRAADLDPNEPSTYLDLGEALVDDGRFDEAARSFAEASTRDATSAAARAASAYVGVLRTNDPDARAELARLAATGDAHARARADDLASYDTHLPDPSDATARVVRHVLARAATARPGPIQVRVRASEPEPPSVHVALTLGLRLVGREGELTVTPDSTRSRCDDDATLRLWRFDGQCPRPAVPPPPRAIAEAARTLAGGPFDVAAWWARAPAIVTTFSPGERDLISHVMVHPPPPPRLDDDPLLWVLRVQIAAALLIARADGGWADSARRRSLVALARGPSDWTSAAAAIALWQVARDEPLARGEIAATLGARLDAISDERTTHAHILATCLTRIDGVDPEARRRYWQRKRRIERHSP